MEVTVLKCKLKKDVPNGEYVYFEKRSKGKEFEIVNPDPGVELNVSKLCDIKKTIAVIPDAVEVINSQPKEDQEELITFAKDSWDLAVKYQEELKKVNAEMEKLKRLTPKVLQNDIPSAPRKKKAK